MKLLLDTHTLLWFLGDDPKLPEEIKAQIEASPDVLISIGAFWEMAIKESIGKLDLPVSVSVLMADCENLGFRVLPIRASHLEKLKSLPRLHGDPFDRLYVCQAQAEGLTLVTADENIPRYAVNTLWA